MSTITVTNIKATGETASRAAIGVAAVLLQYKHSTNTILSSQNVSSVTDEATGKYDTFFTSQFSSANYSGVAMGRGYHSIMDTNADSKEAGSLLVRTWYVSNTSGGRTNIDLEDNSLICTGVLA